jgi:23S rRNA pseudouridine2605 synthase
MRLNKFMAECGIASRRACDEIIRQGRVRVNNKTVTELGVDVDEIKDRISVDGKRVQVKRATYIMLHKPKGYVTTVKDEKGRKTVMELVDIDKRVYPVGRLDYDTEGLLILTNDGDLTFKLTHPRHEVYKTYVARIDGQMSENELKALKDGVEIDGEKTAPANVSVLEFDGENNKSRVELSIREGKNHQVKKMFEAVGKNVLFLKRTKMGEISLGGLSRGKWRFLNDKEIAYLNSL